MLQGGLRLSGMYSPGHPQVQALLQNAISVLNGVLSEADVLSISFQFNGMVLNSQPVSDPTLSWLAGELTKREIAFINFSRGADVANLAAVIAVLTTRPEVLKEMGGVTAYLREHPLEHARIVAARSATDDSTLEEAPAAAAGGTVPRWLLPLLEQLKTSGNTQAVGAGDLQALSASLALGLTHEQRGLLPQLQELVAHLARTSDASALSEIARSVSAGGAGELAQAVLPRALAAAAAKGERAQAENLLRSAIKLRVPPDRLLGAIPADAPAGLKQALTEYAAWLSQPVPERLARLSGQASALEFGWLLSEAEEAGGQGEGPGMLEVVQAVFQAPPAGDDAEWAAILARAQALLARACAGALPSNAAQFLDALSSRLRDTQSAAVAAPLLGSVAILTRAAADAHNLPLATSGAALVAQLAGDESPAAPAARRAHATLLKPETLARLIDTYVDKKADADGCLAIQKLLKRLGPQAAIDLVSRLETEMAPPRRFRILQLLKLLGRPAVPVLVERIGHPDNVLVHDIVVTLGEIGDPAMLDHLGPALIHPDERVQEAAVLAAQRTRSSARATVLARALLHLKPAVLDSALEDLVVLKEPGALPYLEEFILHHSPGVLFHQVEKGLLALGAVGTNDAVQAALRCANATALPLPYRQTAIRVLARIDVPASQAALKYFVRTETDPQLIEEASRFVSVWDERAS